MDTIREWILAALAARFDPPATRSPTVQDFDTDYLVGLSDDEQSPEVHFQAHRYTMLIRLEATRRLAPDEPLNRSTIANRLLGTLIATMSSADSDPMIAALTERIDPGDSGTLYPPRDALVIGAYAEWTIVYWTDAGNPYAYTTED